MSTSIKLDDNCDIVFNAEGVCELVNEAADIVQAIRVELEQNKEQWALNILYGMPYLNKRNTGLLQQKDNKDKIKQELIRIISKYEVEKIESIEFVEKNIEVKIKINGEVYKI